MYVLLRTIVRPHHTCTIHLQKYGPTNTLTPARMPIYPTICAVALMPTQKRCNHDTSRRRHEKCIPIKASESAHLFDYAPPPDTSVRVICIKTILRTDAASAAHKQEVAGPE